MSAQRWKRWLRRKLNRYSPDAALRWMFRHGARKGHKRGYEKGFKEGSESVPPIVNRCMMHNLPTYPRIVEIADGRWVEMWCCPRWDAHTKEMPSFPDVERFTDKVQRPMLAYLDAQRAGAGPHTAMERAIKRQPHPTVKLSPDHDRR